MFNRCYGIKTGNFRSVFIFNELSPTLPERFYANVLIPLNITERELLYEGCCRYRINDSWNSFLLIKNLHSIDSPKLNLFRRVAWSDVSSSILLQNKECNCNNANDYQHEHGSEYKNTNQNHTVQRTGKGDFWEKIWFCFSVFCSTYDIKDYFTCILVSKVKLYRLLTLLKRIIINTYNSNSQCNKN